MSFIAKYGQRCAAACGQPIEPGQEVQYDLEDSLVHVDCPAGEDVLAVAAKPCRGCWQVPAINGECGCT